MEPISEPIEGVIVTIGPRERAPQAELEPTPADAGDEPLEATLTAPVDAPPQPVHSVRSETQGARGCWAISTRTGQPCGAAARRGEDYCNAHSGVGVASDPRAHMPLAHEARRENLRVRAEMRLALGSTRPNSPRAILRARANADAERLADAAVRDGLKNGALALKVIREVDPAPEVTVRAELPTSVEELEGLSLSQLMALAERHGINPSRPPLPPASEPLPAAETL